VTRKAPKTRAAAQPERELAAFIEKFEPHLAELIRDCRQRLRELLPTANELVYDNYNFFVIGYSSTLRPSDCIVSIAASANGVALSFYYGVSVPDSDGLLLGSGKQNRYIRLPSAEILRNPGVRSLIESAVAQGKTQPASTGQGSLVIQSVSAKQRPRRTVENVA